MANQYLKNILVTGAAGFIGSNFVHYILKTNNFSKVISLDKLTYAGDIKNLRNLPDASRHFFVKGDICDRYLVAKLLREYAITTIVHFAAESHVDRSILGPADFIQTNIVGTFTLLDAARHYWFEEKQFDNNSCRFHHISTDEVYGELKQAEPPFTELSPYKPSSPYSASKAAADHLVRSYFRTYGLPVTISNCSNNYGPHQHAEKLIPTVINCCLQHMPIPVYGDGSNIRDWIYVTDHCNAINAILEKGKVGETYNVGGDTEVANLSLVKMVCKIIDNSKPAAQLYEKLITFVTDRLGHDWRYAINGDKVKHDCLWEKQVTLEQGLMLTVDYYLGSRYEK
jgi:dTDP-glucose 4,6-dehydratase